MTRRALLLPLLLSCVACAQAPRRESAPPLVVLLTDFGLQDDAVGLMRGVIHSVAPTARIADLTHQVPVFDVEQGARLLVDGPGVYPPGTVFCVVVDPGVGTARRAIVATLENGRVVVAPDNGVISGVAQRYGVREVREVTNRALMREEVSSTFHGRDVFAPVAAHLARGVPIAEVGPLVTDWVKLEPRLPSEKDGALYGIVEALDMPFGNVLSNIPAAWLSKLGVERGGQVSVKLGEGDPLKVPWVSTFGDVPTGESLLYVNSRGKVSLALNMASFAEAHGVSRGTAVVIQKVR
jgi:S-adenosylmethionine hydrolase